MTSRHLPWTAMVCALLALTACPKNVPQDKNTGTDGRPKGAKKITFEETEGRSSGIVTYPGGDRIDWKLLELPEGKTGTLNVKLRWTPPRPGLDLSFEVYDQWGNRVGGAKPSKRRVKRSKSAAIENARGNYYIQVYASERGDAGKYNLSVELDSTMGIDPSRLEIPDPPRLAAVPEAPVPCDENNFSKGNPSCRSVCPSPPDMAWPGCSGKCPSPPSVDIPACHASMPCPSPPDRRVKDCRGKFPPCDPDKIDPENPNCDNYKAPPVKGLIINVKLNASGEAIITINRGSEKGVKQGWTGRILRAGGAPLTNGTFTVVTVSKRESVGKVKLSTDVLNRNRNVELSAP